MMENLIDEILQFEKEAQNLMADANKQRESLNGDMEVDAKRIEEQVFQSMSEKIEKIKETENVVLEERLEEIDNDKNVKLEHLRSLYAKKADEWIEVLFAKLFA